jgi:hypothetical protein
VTDTVPGEALMTGKLGGGVAVFTCSNVTATRLRVLDSADYGVLVDGSTATLGDSKDVNGTAEISRNLRGLWIQNIADGASVSLHNGTLAANRGVGIGVVGESRGIVICRSTITGTLSQTMPVFDENMLPSSKEVGYGVSWLDGSEVVIEALTLGGSAHQSLLIDGPATGNIMSLTLTDGDEARPPLQQGLMTGGDQPLLGDDVSLTSQPTRKFAVPQALTVPAAP